MDWSKAKTILIVSFIVVNALLIYALYQDNQQIDMTIKEEFIEDAARLLSNKDITIGTEIPKDPSSLPSLIVKYENLQPSDLNTNFFDDKGIVTTKGEGLVELNYKDENITIVNEKLLMYTSISDKKQYDIKNEEEAIEIALDFLINKNFSTLDMELSFIKYANDIYYIEFSKVHNDIVLESAFTNIQLDKTGVKNLERLWLNVVETGESPIYISSAPKSILGLLSMNEVYGKTIKDISLCHYFDPEKHEYIEDPDTAKEGRTLPAWRVQFTDGYKVFIDDY